MPERCTVCGTELRPGNRFCTKCGSPVPEIKEVPKKKFCTECGAALEEGSKFCRECGAKITGSEDTGITLPVNGKAVSVKVSDDPPKKTQSAEESTDLSAKSAAKKYTDSAFKQIIHLLSDTDISASSSPGEISLPMTEAQNEFIKLIKSRS